MSGRIVKLDTLTHQAVQELLPWFVMNTLDADEMALVQEHLRTCTQCQSDADWQHKLRAAAPQSVAIPDVGHALARLRPRLEAPQRQPERHALSAFLLRLSRTSAPWMRWAVLGQAVMIVILTTILLVPPEDGIAPYRGLGTPGSATGNIVVMFNPETTERELRQILQESGARVVDGPTVADAYVLSVPSTQKKRAIGILRSKRAVALAEPLDSGGGR